MNVVCSSIFIPNKYNILHRNHGRLARWSKWRASDVGEAKEGKVFPLQAMKAHGDVDARVHIFTAKALGWGRVASPMLGRLYTGEIPRYSFYRRMSGPQGQFGHEVVKKNLHPLRHLGSNPGRPARSQAPCRLNHLAHEAKEGLENELWRRCSDGKVGEWAESRPWSESSWNGHYDYQLYVIHF